MHQYDMTLENRKFVVFDEKEALHPSRTRSAMPNFVQGSHADTLPLLRNPDPIAHEACLEGTPGDDDVDLEDETFAS